MKKNFIYSVLCLVLCLFAACSQDEIVSESTGQSKVTLSVRVPDAGPTSRAANLDVADHKLRCIMEMTDAQGAVVKDSRQVSEVTKGKATFTIDKTQAEGGKCLFWADYVPSDATDLKADNIYKTSAGLTAVDYPLNKNNSLFSNNAVDAFCASIDVSNVTAATNVTLKRPFTRLAVTTEDLKKMGSDLNKVILNLNVGSGYNVATGTTSSMKGLSNSREEGDGTKYIPIDVLTSGGYAFYCYIFPTNSSVTKSSTIEFQKDADGNSKKRLSITPEQLKTIKPNYAITIKPNEGGEGGDKDYNVTIEIDNAWAEEGTNPNPNPEPEPGATLKIGDYIKADGTVATTESEAVAVVFAVGAGANDAVGNYSEKSGKTIAGYAMSLESVIKNVVKAEKPTLVANNDWTSYKGFGYSNAFIATVGIADGGICKNFDAWKSTAAVNTDATSGWYIPTFAQMVQLSGLCLGIGEIDAAAGIPAISAVTKNDALAAKINTTSNQFIIADASGKAQILNFITSTITDSYIACVQLTKAQGEGVSTTTFTKGLVPSFSATQSFSIRPVLTIFADAPTN